MPTLCAIDLDRTDAVLVTAEADRSTGISVLDVTNIDLNQLFGDPPPSAESGELPESTGLRNGSGAPSRTLTDIVKREVDNSFATIRGDRVLFEYMKLPFREQRKVDQIVQVQLEDLIPFEPNSFIIDSVVVEPGNGAYAAATSPPSSHTVISAMVPELDISDALSLLEGIGANPKIVTTKASAICGLTKLCGDQLKGEFGIVVLHSTQASLALFTHNKLQHLREFPLSSQSIKSYQDCFRDIRCSVGRVEMELGILPTPLYLIGTEDYCKQVSEHAGMSFRPLDLANFVRCPAEVRPNINEYAWAIGIFAQEVPPATIIPGPEGELPSPAKPRSPLNSLLNLSGLLSLFGSISRRSAPGPRLINFRRGAFAFKPALGNLLEAIELEWEWFAFAFAWGLIWLATILYLGGAKLRSVDNTIRAELTRAFPGEVVPYRGEIGFVDDKLATVKTQLQGLGSLASLSPLETLRELSESIHKELQVTVDSVKIGSKGVTLSGSVPDSPTIGKLNTALTNRKERFCKVTINPRSRGAGKVGFDAEIVFCE